MKTIDQIFVPTISHKRRVNEDLEPQ